MKRWLGVLLFSMLSAILWGQTGTSRITGTVVDPSGASLAGAKVTAQNEATNVAWTTTSGSSGSYSLESIPPGRYSIKLEAAGFKTVISHGNILSIGQPATVNAQLELGSTAESVDVVGTAETVQTSSSGNFGNIVDQIAVTELPIVGVRGRNPLGLVNFQPGIVVGGNASSSSVHAHGARDRAWNYTLDGVDINETSAPGGNFSPLRTNPDMLAEFRVITGNATADQGRASGGDVAMVTRSGTNQFHGNAFFFYQTPSFNANTVQNKLSPPFLPRDQFVQKIGGFSLGGPIWKNKTFFFGNFQFLRTLRTQKITRLVYTDQARHGIFRYVTQPPGNPDSVRNEPASGENPSVDFQGNVLPGVNISTYDIAANDPDGRGLDRQLTDFIGLTPLPNDFSESGDGLNVAGFTWVPAERENQSDYLIKVDHVFNQQHSLFVRWASGHQDTNGDIVNDGQPPFPGTPNWVNTQRTPRNLAINWRWVPTNHSTNELVLGMNRFTFGFANGDPNVNGNPPFVLNNMEFSDLPLHNDQGNFRALTTYQLSDNFSLVKGTHSFRWGGQILYQRHIDDRGSIGNFNTNPWVFFDRFTNPVSPSAFNLPASEDQINSSDYGTLRSTVNDLLGRVGEIDIGLAAANESSFRPVGSFFNFDSRFPEYDLYVQDNWKIRPNLVIDAGLRWEIRMSPQNPHNQILRPDQAMVFNGTPSDNISWVPGNLYNNAFKNFGPSIGVAWDPKGDGKMSVRANYRLAYDRINTFVVSSGIIQTLPGLTYSYANTAFGSDGGRLADGLPSLIPSDVTPASLRTPPPFSTNFATVMDPNIVTPRTHMWGLSIQRELPGQLVLEANYIGRHGSHLFGGYDANAHEIGSNGFLDGFKQLKAGQDSPLFDALLANYDNLDAGQTGSQYMMDNFGTEIGYNSIGELAKFINQTLAPDGVTPIIVANGFSPFFFTRYPQFADEVDTLDTNDWSNYHALELQLQRRFSNGLQFQMSYTFAKSLDTRSFDPAFSTVPTGRSQSSANIPFNNQDRSRNYARSDFDRRHALQGDFVWDLPFGHGGMWLNKNGWMDRAVGGWSLAGILTLQSGRPFTVYSGGYTFNDTVMTPASCNGCSPGMGKLHWEGGDPFSADASRYYFTPEQRAKFTQPEAGTLSNIGRNYFTLPPNFNLDMALGKRFRITESQDLQLRLEVQNLTNSVVFDAPSTGSSDITGSTFGLMTRIYNTPRKMQVSAKYTF